MIEKFSNGLTLIFRANPTNEIAGVFLFVRQGSSLDKPEKAGLANLMQQVIRKGTKRYSSAEIVQTIESLGGELSSAAEKDFLELSLVITQDHLAEGMEILFSIVQEPTFSPAEIEKERAAVLAAIRAEKDQIFSVSYDRLRPLLFGQHPYAWSTIGQEETVKRIERNDLVSLWERIYCGRQLILVIVGNLSPEIIKEKISAPWGGLPAGENSLAFFTQAQPSEGFCHQERQKFQQAYLMEGYPAPAVNHPDYPVMRIINTLLGERMSSRLFLTLREEEPLAYEVNSFYPSRREGSALVLYLGLAEDNLSRARAILRRECERLKESRLAESELAEVKGYIRGTYLLQHQTNLRQAWFLGWWELLGKGAAYDFNYLKDIEQVQPADIQRVAQRYLNNPPVTVELLPRDE